MQDIDEIGEHVSSLIDTRKSNEINELFLGIGEKKKMKRSNKFLKGSGLLVLVILISSLITMAALLTIYSTCNINQSDSITLEGKTTPALKIDGIHQARDTGTLIADTFTDDKLTNGETETFTHTIESEIGRWDYLVDSSAVTFTEPTDPHFGYVFTATPNSGIANIGTIESIEFKHELDENFMECGIPLDYSVDLIITKHINANPVTPDFTFTLSDYTDAGDSEGYIVMDVLATCTDAEGDPLYILSVTQGDLLECIHGGTELDSVDPALLEHTAYPQQIYYHGMNENDHTFVRTFTYTVVDDFGGSSTGTITLNLT